MSLLARIRSILSIHCLIGILLLALSLRVVAYFGVRIEDLQFVYFPVLLIVLFFLPSAKRYRIPSVLLVLAVGLWLLASAHVEGYLPKSNDAGIATKIARLEGDTSGMEARSLYLRINQIARTYSLPSAEMMRLSLSDESSAHEWKKKHADCSLLVRGNSEWLLLDLCVSLSKYLHPLFSAVSADLDNESALRAEKWRLKAKQEVLFIALPGISQPFALLYQPESIVVPGQPEELARHWIAWFAAALPIEQQSLGSAQELENFFAERLDVLNEASLISGPWKSDAPRAVSDYLSGTLYLLQSSVFGSFASEEALKHFREAAGRVNKTTSAELFSAIFNNAALARIASAQSLEDLKKARAWLQMATEASGQRSGSASLRTAFYNLELLDRFQLGRQ